MTNLKAMIRFYYILLLFIMAQNTVYSQATSVKTSQTKQNKASGNNDHLTYTVKVSEGDARCQILINDVPLMYYEGRGDRSFYANGAILNSGSQSIKIVTEGKTPLVTITETKNVPREYRQKEIWKNEGSLQGSFIAAVPYDIAGWKYNKALPNDKTIQTEALTWFEQMGELLKNGKGSEFMSQLGPAEKTAAVLYNLKEEEMTQFHNGWTGYINKKDYTMIPVSECKIEIVGNAKLVHLVNKLKEGGFVLKANNGQMVFLDIYLHLPEHKTKLEPILANFKEITTDFKKARNN